MAELWDVAAHVESNPGDYPQRWRLAKKLYAAHEYRLALEHLNVLKNEWVPKVNVHRYLAATYYRLGRYEEAIKELEQSIKEWPDELGMREQLAYVLKADKQLEPAMHAWEEVLRLQPDHSIAQKSIKKIKQQLLQGEEVHEAETKIDPAIPETADVPTPPPMPGMECPKCGAQNSEEFGDCWRCGSPLPHAKKMDQPLRFDMTESSFFIESKLLGRVGAIAAMTAMVCALLLGVMLLQKYNEGLTALTSLDQIYSHELVPSRFAAGLAILLCWPFALRLTILAFRIKPRPKAIHMYIGGILLGALALVVLLAPLPAPLLVPANALLFFMALVVCVVAFQFRMGSALLVWATHFTIMVLLGVGVFWGTEIYRYGDMLNPIAEINTLWKFSHAPGDSMSKGPIRLPSSLTPIESNVQWESSGSAWLDKKIASVTITVRVEDESSDFRFQIYEDDKLKFHEELGNKHNHQFYYAITPGNSYEFKVIGSENQIVQVLLQSLLPFEFRKQ